MADGDIAIKDLSEALQISDNAEFVYTQDNGGTNTTFKAPVNQIARKIAESVTYTNLETTNKTLVGAINELSHLGNPILLGTTAPTSSQGADGNIYVQYTEGTGGNPDTVDSIYAKIDGAWCEIETGGGGGTTDYEDLSNKPQVNSVELVGNKSLDDLGIMPASLSKTVSGSLVHITDGADNIPVKSLVSQIVAVETGNGQPKSPDNPYTISGFSQADISVMGKNIFNSSTITTGSRLDPTNGGVLSSTASYISDYIPVKPTDIKILFDYTSLESSNPRAWCFYDANKGFISALTFDITNKSQIITIPNDTAFMRCTFDNGNTNVRITFDLTATTYEAYNGNTYTFTFGQTVYGGRFDNKGNLVVTHNIVDLGSVTWQYNSPYSVFYTTAIKGIDYGSPFICEIYKDAGPVSISLLENYSGELRTDALYIKNTDYGSDTNAFKTAMNGIMLVRELANPITLSITSQDIPTLLGENNIFSNCGDVEVTYYTNNSDDIAGLIKSVGSGGHTIVDDSGTALTQRTKLQFNGAYSEDNATDDTTEIDVVREMTKAEFDQLTEAEKTGLINITDITGGNDDRFQPVIYSSEEREIGVWKDGKPLYQKTYNATFTNIASDTPQTVADISSIGIDTLVTLDGSCAYSTEDFTFSSNLGGYFICYAYPTGNLTFSQTMTQQTTGRTYVVEVTLYYTKTTDTAGSGQWTPQGVPAHHYSTNEQVVGTWIDGKTLYEKTYDLSSNPIAIAKTWETVATDPTVSQIVNAMALCGAVCENAIEVRVNNSDIQIERVGANEADTRTLTYLNIQYTKTST